MPFIKGDPKINRQGRPTGSGLNLTLLLKEKLEEVPEGQKDTYKSLFVKKLLQKALVEGDMKALQIIINYVDGLPKQSIDLNTDSPLFAGQDAAEIKELAAQMKELIKQKYGA